MRNHSLAAGHFAVIGYVMLVFCQVLILCTLHDLLNLNCALCISLIL